MALPKLYQKTYSLELPSDGTEITFRPFIAKELKTLLMAKESGEEKEMQDAAIELFSACLVKPENLKVEKRPTIDVEFFFLNVIARSIKETQVAGFRMRECPENEGKECKDIIETKIDFLDIPVVRGKESSNRVILQSSPEVIGVNLRLPCASDMDSFGENATDVDKIVPLIESIFDAKSVYSANDVSREELQEFVESLTFEQISKLNPFFENAPKLEKSYCVKCKKCGKEETVVLRGLESFFRLLSETRA